MGCIAMGATFTRPVSLRPMSLESSWSATGISSAMTIGPMVMYYFSIEDLLELS